MERRKRILSVICALCILVTGYSNLLSYVTFAGTQTYTLTASDGNTYKITVSYDEASGIPESAVLNVREIIQEETEPQNAPGVIDAEQTANDAEKEPTYKDYVEKSAELLGEETVTFARVFDITLVDSVTGEVYQPNNDVYVRIRMLDDCLSDFSNVGVVHIHGEQDEKVEILDTKYKGETVEFSTDSFSVYVVVAHEGGEVKNPRVEFHFIDKFTDEQYQAGIGDDTPSRPYNFVNKGGNYQSSQILKKGETLELINDPQNISISGAEKFFYGWYVVDMISDSSEFDESTGKYTGVIKYSWPANPDQIKFEKTISIETNDVNGDGKITVPDYDDSTDDDTVTWKLNGVTGTAALDRTGTAHVYLAPLYEDFFFINFRKGPRDIAAGLVNNLMTRKLVVFGSSTTSSVRIGNVMCESPDPTHKVFSGWEGDINGDGNTGTDEYFKTVKHILDANGNLDNEEVHSNGNSNGYYITVTKNDTIHYIDLYPVFDEARWLFFNTGVKGNGATYIGAAYRLTNDIEESSDNFYYFDKEFFTGSATTTSHLGKRPGYDFEGWYLFANVDPVTGEITNLTTAENVTVKYLDSDSNEHTCTINTTAIKAVDSEGNVLNLGTYYVTPSGEITTTQAEGNIILFKANDGKIRLYKALNEMTVVAKWTPKPVNYTVVYWLQNANNDDYTIASYDKLTAIAGDTIKITSSGNNGRNLTIDAEQWNAYDYAFTLQNTSNTTARYIKELDFIHYKTYDGMSGSTNKGVKIDGDGSTVINVYFDRNLYTLRFDIGYSTGGTWDYKTVTAAETEGVQWTVYGKVNNNYIPLTRDGNGGWTYNDTVTTRHDYDGYRYKTTTGTAMPQYGVVNNSVVELSVSVSYTRNGRAYYTVSTQTSNGNYYIPNADGVLTQVQLYRYNNRWYRTRTGYYNNYSYSNEYVGSVYSTDNNANNTNGTAYSSTVYYFDEHGNVSTSGTGEPYGSTTAGQYFRLNTNSSFTYNGGTNYGNGTRYLRVDNGAADNSYNLGFIDGSMRTVSHDDQGWYYNTEDPVVTTYSGTLYSYDKTGGTATYYVSGLRNSVYYNNFLTTNTGNDTNNCGIRVGTTLPDDFIQRGRYTSGNYTIYYFDLTAKYGAKIDKQWLYKQPARGNYGFIGWVTLRESYYYQEIADSSIKGVYESMDEGVILVGSNGNYTATTSENGIAQEFRCRYQNNTNKYVYRIFFWNPELEDFRARNDPDIELEVSSAGDPKYRAVGKYYGYTKPEDVVVKLVKGNENGNEVDLPNDSGERYSGNDYPVSSVGYNAMIINYYYRPNQHKITYKYVDQTNEIGSHNYYYNQSLASADIYSAQAEANKPNGYSFAGWYENPDGVGSAFNFNNSTMPDGDIILYAIYKPLKYIIKINPNGGELDHVDHNGYASFGTANVTIDGQPYTYDFTNINSAYDKYPILGDPTYNSSGLQTYIRSSYGTTLTLTTPKRRFVPMTDRVAQEYEATGENVYYYVNFQQRATDGASGIYNDIRSALYLTESEVSDFYNLYRNIVLNSLGNYASSNVGMELLDFGTWKSLYVSKEKYRPLNSNETWVFLGWYKTGANGVEESMPYNDSDPVEGPFTLTAHWRLDGGYSIEYVPKYTMPGGAEINGTMPAWRDPVDDTLSYADGAETEIYKAPTGLTKDGVPVIDDSVIFRGWALVSKTGTDLNPVYTPLEVDGDGNITTYYLPSDDYTVNAANAGMDSKLYFQAIYQDRDSSDRRPEIVNLTLDANTGYINTSSSSDLPEWNSSGKSRINDHNFLDGHPTQILFDTVQSSAAVHLYKYATELTEAADGVALTDAHQFFEHPEGYFLLGFDNDAREGDYVAAYPADSVIAVTRTDNRTVYAVWEPMVYLTFVNNTKIKDADDNEIFTGGDVVLNLSSSKNEVLEVINKKNGMYEREPLQNYQITVASGESVTLVFPKGAEKDITISGTNTLGIGKKLIWNTSVDVVENGNTSSYTTDGTSAVSSYTHNTPQPSHSHELAKGEANNTKTFSFDETLIENENAVVVTFTAENNKYALLLDDNYSGHYIEYDYGDEDIAPVNGVPKSQKLTIANTRIGYSFMGWAYSKTATEPDFSSDKPTVETAWTIPDLNSTDGFFSEGTTEEDGVIVRRLYAVWEARTDAIYVYKDVPEPGNQDQAFTFTVSITGKYRYGNNASNLDDINKNKEFKLVHGEFLMITTTNDASSVPESTHSAYIRSVVEVYSPVTNTDGTTSYEKDNSRSGTVEWEKSNVEGKTTNKFENLKISVTEAAVTYYDTSVTVSSESQDDALNVGNNRYTISELPKKVDTDTFYWDNTDAGGTLVFVNQRQEYDVKVEKTLESNTTSQAIFDYSAEYKDTYTNLAGETVTKTYNLDDFQVTSGSYRTLTEIPAGVKLKITEATDLNDNFKTYVSVDGAAETEGKGTGEFTVGENPADAANSTHIVSYRNVLKSYKVTFKLVDQDGNTTINGMFAISSPVGSLGTDLYANSASSNPGVFYTSNEYWADTYTLSQTVIPDNYIGLTSPVTLVVKGKDPYITSNNEYVTVTGNPTDGFTVLVKNWKTVEVRLNAGLLDPIVNQRTFEFNGTYTLDGKLYDLSRTLLGTGDTPGVIKLTTNSTNDGSEIAANRIVLRIPVHAESLTINEDTSVITVGTQTIGQTYKIEYKYNTGERTAGTSYDIGNIGVDDSYRTLIFYHERNTKNITVKKTVIADTGNAALDDTYTFNFYIKRGNVPIPNYKVYDDDDDAKDLITDTDGKVEFSLKNNETFIVRFPVGADVTVEEALNSTQAEKYAVFMTMPGVDLELVNGKADTVTLTGPTEDKNIYVYNIPSICKVTDENGDLLYVWQEGWDTPDSSDDIYIPAIYPTIKGAFEGRLYSAGEYNADTNPKIGGLGNYYQKDSTDKYTATNLHNVEMLVDYEVPDNDVVVVGAGYDMVFTTASTSATDGYPFRRTGVYTGSVHENGEVPEGIPTADSIGRAVLTRKVDDSVTVSSPDDDKMKAFFTVSTTNAALTTRFEMSNLIIDGNDAILRSNVRGGCLTAYNSDVTIGNCVIYRFEAAEGGAVFTTGASLTVTNSVFDTCKSDKKGNGFGGGGINTMAGTLTVEDTTFKNCSAIHQGGAVYHYGGSVNNQGAISINKTGKDKVTTISRCIFEDCFSRAGGGVEADVGKVTVTDCQFIRCKTQDMPYVDDDGKNQTDKGASGGGLNNYTTDFTKDGYDGSELTVSGCSFLGCSLTTTDNKELYGGGLRSTAKTTELTGCTFGDDETDPSNPIHCSSAKHGGGAAFIKENGTVTVNGCTFTNCTATSNGGAIYTMASDVTIQKNGTTETEITGSSATNFGGGIYVKGGLEIKDSTAVESCTSKQGGAIYADGADTNVMITGCDINGNNASASEGGGAIRVVNGATVTVNGGAISNNYVEFTGGNKNANGGAISAFNGTVNVGGGTISGNYVKTAQANNDKEAEGGAIYVSAGILNVTGGSITGNYTEATTNGSYGGAIVVTGPDGGPATVATISGGTISGNHTMTTNKDAFGGAIAIRKGAQLTVSGGTISGNYAEAKIKNYTNKERFANGGAIAVESGTLNLTGGTITGNVAKNTGTATGAAANARGAGIYLAEGTTLNVSGNPNFGGADTINADETHSFTPGVGNLMQTTLSGQKNGDQDYVNARQDIYIAGYSGAQVTSLNVTGNISSGVGSIWVWAEAGNYNHVDNDHIHEGDQFGFHIAGSVAESSLNAFRNARTDTDSGASGAALYGVKGDGSTVIWGYISDMNYRKVILRKVQAESNGNPTYVPLSGAIFTIYKGTSTDPYTVKDPNKIKPDEVLQNLQSKSSGVIWIGMLPYGKYYICETTIPTGYKQITTDDSDGYNWYILTVNEKGVGYEKADKSVINQIRPETNKP